MRDDGMSWNTWFISLLCIAMDGVPHPVGCCRHLELVVADRVRDSIDDGRRCADRARLATAFDAQRIARTQRCGVAQLERWQIVGARHGIIHERCGDELARTVIDGAFEQRLADSLGEPSMNLA